MITRRGIVVSLLFAAVPIVALWTYQGLKALHDYQGSCGLLDAGWACSKAQYVEYTLSSVFVFPFLAAVSIGWLIVVTLAALICSRQRKQFQTIDSDQ
jgi:hypothetical protein